MISKEFIAEKLRELQTEICTALEIADSGVQNNGGSASHKFSFEEWTRAEGGGGITRILQHGHVIEKGGVNFSAVHGELPETIQRALQITEKQFFATGVSIVIHPSNPFVPIIHMNVRYFELANGMYWFGGGIDLTPHYVNEAEARYFHGELKKVCDKHHTDHYPKFKQWADDYFFIKHRNETRGIGGIFFDRLSGTNDEEKERTFSFLMEVGKTFAPMYTSLMVNNASKKFNEKNKQWQMIRRGRYVEFNLLYDKGTRFGLDTNGRIESILMSLPENASWLYDHRPEEGSPEKNTLNFLKKGISWV